ncbi:bidirectional sugar transporter SWEET1 [Cinnamomum micranthum f. kanehirae]|uniref:Bidirectional sugar transporter SWEET n=1 Tax=Cinnamomum micranthum f. kanehirae TaxID=337451 RepID=A0A3S3NPX8_9MAGN|nr:bidirectional sugar transporter SWEET1 [Cinnamomum micranthum f. kanehirae]
MLHLFFGILGNVTGMFLFLAPVITFRRIIKSKSTEDFSGVPYNMTLLNCLLSAWYGLPFVSPHNMLVSTISGTGAALEAVYVAIFLFYAPNKQRANMLGLLMLVLIVFAIVALKLVIQTKSVEFMPFFLSLFVFLCGSSWFIFGLLGHDPFLAVRILSFSLLYVLFEFSMKQTIELYIPEPKVPNGFGSGLGAIQLILYAIYRDKGNKKGKGDEGPSETNSIELGSVASNKPPPQ